MNTSPASSTGGFCCVCRCACSHDNAIMLEGQWICGACKPNYLDMLKNGTKPTDLLVARSGKVLVMGRKAQLPHRCVKCNEPAEGAKLKRKLACFSPWWYLLLLVNLLICAIVIMCVQKKAEVEVGLCGKHRSKRSVGLAVGWGSFALLILALVVGIGRASNVLLVVGIVLAVAGFVFAIVSTRVVSAVKIDEDTIRLKGVCPAFLDALPRY